MSELYDILVGRPHEGRHEVLPVVIDPETLEATLREYILRVLGQPIRCQDGDDDVKHAYRTGQVDLLKEQRKRLDV